MNRLARKIGAPTLRKSGIGIRAHESFDVGTSSEQCGVDLKLSRELRDPCSYKGYGRA